VADIKCPRCWVLFAFFALVLAVSAPLAAERYRETPAYVGKILDWPPSPLVLVDPQRQHVLLAEPESLPPIAALAQPSQIIDGTPVNARNNARHGSVLYRSLQLIRLESGQPTSIELPRNARIGVPVWAPNGTRYAFTMVHDKGVELWIGEPDSGRVRRILGPVLNATRGSAFFWMPDSERIVCRLLPAQRGRAPPADAANTTPLIRDSAHTATAPHGADPDSGLSTAEITLRAYYMGAQLAMVDVRSGALVHLGLPGVFDFVQPSPDGTFLLVSQSVHRSPKSSAQSTRATSVVTVWDALGRSVHELSSPIEAAPAASAASLARRARAHGWRQGAPATLVWAESISGLAATKAAAADRIMVLAAPFSAAPLELLRLDHRFAGISWLERGNLALVKEFAPQQRLRRTWLVDAGVDAKPPRLVWERDVDDRYGDAGQPMLASDGSVSAVVVGEGTVIYLSGDGAGANGLRPFLDRLSLHDLHSERIWQSAPNSFEKVVALLSADGPTVLVRHESEQAPPNYYIRELTGTGALADSSKRWITHRSAPGLPLRGVESRLLKYQRADGLELSATLYLPASYQPGQRLPMVLSAYPHNFSNRSVARQVAYSPHRHRQLQGITSLWFLTRGYAVLDPVSIPVIGETGNETFVEQVVDDARAAVQAVVELGIADPQRIGIIGHSYGAFLVVNLLAHSDLFAAGIAMSGAYNRTMTPFGFQTERRTLWQAPDTYLAMSPFLHADRINAPLLLVHGALDNNFGTRAEQSERLYRAIAAHSGRARLVVLPFEGHTIRARESVAYVLAESFEWFDEHVKRRRLSPDTGEDLRSTVHR
jgi:dipeptidyl aminopeptidase/acylaminoacyl peptidase